MLVRQKQSAFTIVELLIVIVVIGILAAITIISYNGVTRQAMTAAMKSEISSAAQQLGNDNAQNGSYPTSKESANGGAGLKSGAGRSFQYIGGGLTFCLTITSSQYTDLVYSTDQDGPIKEGACSGPPPVATNVTCFGYYSLGDGLEAYIYGYYSNQSDDVANPACPRDVVIPSEIDGMTVTGIGDYAFFNLQLTSVIIPSSVTGIGISAFKDNEFATVTISPLVQFIEQVFDDDVTITRY